MKTRRPAVRGLLQGVAAIGARLGRSGTTRAPEPPAPSPLVEAAAAAGWKPTAGNRAFLRTLERAAGDRPDARFAVLVASSPRSRDLSGLLAAAYPLAQVTCVGIRGGWSRVHVLLASGGPFDVIVDDTRRGPGRATLFRRTFFHLVEGGVFLVRRYAVETRQLAERGEESVEGLVTRLAGLESPPVPPERWSDKDELALAGSIGRVVRRGRHLLVTKTGASYAKLNEDETNELLSLRGSGTGRLLLRQEPLTFGSRATTRESPSPRNGGLPRTFDVPAMCLREYGDVVCASGQVVLKDNVLLTDTYRHIRRRRLGNRFTRELAPRFAVPDVDVEPRTELSGWYFYLDDEFPGHFGHAVTDQLSRLWAWPEAKRAHPGLKALLSPGEGRTEPAGFEVAMYAAAGIEPEDIEMISGPVRVEKLLAATPMLGNPAYVHPRIAEVWGRVGRRLSDAAPARRYPDRIFCSRREQTGPGTFPGIRRSCRNNPEVEAFFVAHGFTVVHPEEHSLAEQVRMFRTAEVIAGYAGSAMFNLVFSERPKHVVLVSSEAYVAKNEYLIASVLGHHLDMVWCRPDPMAEDVRGTALRNASFALDFDREGRFLADVLGDLDPPDTAAHVTTAGG